MCTFIYKFCYVIIFFKTNSHICSFAPSYLVIPNIVSAAVTRGCTMLHPGYGFLSENATFVDICRDHGINFIGPNVSDI